MNIISVMTSRQVIFKWCGRLRYSDGLTLQKEAVAKHKQKQLVDAEDHNVVLLLEHKPVYTVGRRHQSYSIDEQQRLEALGADFHRTDRGGLITFHGPGQLVAYPILNLSQLKLRVRGYVCALEKCVIDLCLKHYNLETTTSQHTGVWTKDGQCKLSAIGVHVQYGGITSHGIALNCDTDLRWFSHIVPCGIQDKQVTSLTQQMGHNVPIKEVLPHFVDSLSQQLGVQCRFDDNYDQFMSQS